MSMGQTEMGSAVEPFSRKALLIVGISIVLLFFVLNDLLGLIEGGGLISTLRTVRAVPRSAALQINIDGAGLRTIFITACSAVGTLVALSLKWDLRSRLPQFLFIFLIVGGGFTLDAIYDGTIVQRFLSAHVYNRCSALDFSRGNGKSRVWFEDYVRDTAKCPQPQ